jgi:RNA methyltransferase, TrmH family
MEIREITSPTNSLLKVFRRALADGVTRDGLLAVEGSHLVEEALSAASVIVHSVLVSASGATKFRGLLDRLPREAEAALAADGLFQKVALTENPQGIAALVELRTRDLTSVLTAKDALLLVACGIQDPGNLGTMMRSAQAFGATALITMKQTVSPFNPKVVRSSAGAIFRLPVFHDVKSEQLFRPMRGAGVRIVAADRHSPTSLAATDLRGAVAFLIGREASGLPPELAREANLLLSIPLRPETDSVNAATAAGIFLYEAARQRGFRYL